MFNPRPHIERVPFIHDGVEHGAAWVIDDVLLDPEALADRAVRERANFVAAPHNAYPGLEWQMGNEVSQPLADFFMLQVRALLGARRTLGMVSRLALATLQPQQLRPLQRLCHRDRFGVEPGQGVAACVIYLFDTPELGGTSFFKARRSTAQINADMQRWGGMIDSAFTQETGAPPAYLTTSNAHFDLLHTVPAAWNRAVFYDGAGFHSPHLTRPELLSTDPARGRLTLNGFFVTRQVAQ